MNYNVISTDTFKRDLKPLMKKYQSLLKDLKQLEKDLLENPEMGIVLSHNTRKVRMAIASKNKGKSGGARVITCNVLVSITNTVIYLLTIYDKSEQDTISEKRITELKQENGLL
jgi:mRNA-degrading endonuclease RelE of RelBE toxin-antitoxin system